MGYLNAKVGSERMGRQGKMGPHGIGTMNIELFSDFCAMNSLEIGGTCFPLKTCHKTTWVSPTGDTENQTDHIAVTRRWRPFLQDVRTKRGADVSSDDHLLVAKIKLKLLGRKRTEAKRRKFNIDRKFVNKYQYHFKTVLAHCSI